MGVSLIQDGSMEYSKEAGYIYPFSEVVHFFPVYPNMGFMYINLS
jgi:hypothetical protein